MQLIGVRGHVRSPVCSEGLSIDRSINSPKRLRGKVIEKRKAADRFKNISFDIKGSFSVDQGHKRHIRSTLITFCQNSLLVFLRGKPTERKLNQLKVG